MIRVVIEHPVTHEQRVLLPGSTFNRPWHIVGYENLPEPIDMGAATPLDEDPELEALALFFGVSAPLLLDRARDKFGRNTSIKGLITAIKARGL